MDGGNTMNMSWFGCYVGDFVDLVSLLGIAILAIGILSRGLVLNLRGQRHHLVAVCFALALACFALGITKGSVATISAIQRTPKGEAECYIPAWLFLRPIVGYGSATIAFSVIAALLASTKRKEDG